MPSGTYLNLILLLLLIIISIIKNAIKPLEKKKKKENERTLPPPITHFPQLLIHSFINSHSSNASKNPTATTHISGEYKKPVKICSVKMELVIRISRIWIVLPKMGERKERERKKRKEGGREG